MLLNMSLKRLKIILFIRITFSYIILPFYTFHMNEKNYSTNDLFNNILYTHLSIGTPPQLIVALIEPNEYQLNIFN